MLSLDRHPSCDMSASSEDPISLAGLSLDDLRRLEDGLPVFSDSLPPTLVAEALEGVWRARTRVLGRLVSSAAKRSGPASLDRIAVTLARHGSERLGMTSTAELRRGFLGVAGKVGDTSLALAVLDVLKSWETSDADRQEEALLRLFLEARKAYEAGEVTRATLACQEAITAGSGEGLLHVRLLWLLALCYRRLDDKARELAPLGRLWRALEALRGGPVGQAGRLIVSENDLGSPLGAGMEILAAGSRLAVLLEEGGDVEGAKGVLVSLLNGGLHPWRDPELPSGETVEERFRRLDGNAVAEPSEAEDEQIRLIEPAVGYRGIAAETIGDIVAEVGRVPSSKGVLVLLRHEEIAVSRFDGVRGVTAAESGLCQRMRDLLREESYEPLGLSVEPRTVTDDSGKSGRWLLVTNTVASDVLSRVAFGVRAGLVGTQFEVSVSSVVIVRAPGLPAFDLRLVAEGRFEQEPGFRTLRDAVVRVVQRAASALASKVAAPWAEEDRRG